VAVELARAALQRAFGRLHRSSSWRWPTPR
jgi:hypothetical protein